MKQSIKKIFNQLPYVKRLYRENELYRKNACYPPGHYYSPIISVEDIKAREFSIWKNIDKESVSEIDLNLTDQKSMLKDFENYYAELPFSAEKIPD